MWTPFAVSFCISSVMFILYFFLDYILYRPDLFCYAGEKVFTGLTFCPSGVSSVVALVDVYIYGV